MSHKYPRTGKRGAPQAFARKLYEILCTESASVISWSETGDSFFINDLDEFVNAILLKYFRHQKFSSFQRQLNLYGFRKVHKGPDTGGYSHQFFKRGQPELLDVIRRTPQSNSRRNSRQRQSSCDDDHDFDDEEEEHERDEDEEYSTSTSVPTPSCMSSITNCFSSTGVYNTRASTSSLPPPPSYDAVLKADLGLSTGVQPSMQRLKRGLSNQSEGYERQPPQPPTGVCCFSNMPYNPTLLSEKVFAESMTPGSWSAGKEMFDYNDWDEFDTGCEIDESIFTSEQPPMDFGVSGGYEEPEQKYRPPHSLQYRPEPWQGMQRRPSFNRMFSTQSQEWEIDNSITNDIDFDFILDAPPAIPTATPVVCRAGYPVAQAEVVQMPQQGGALIPPRTPCNLQRRNGPLPPVPRVNMAHMYS